MSVKTKDLGRRYRRADSACRHASAAFYFEVVGVLSDLLHRIEPRADALDLVFDEEVFEDDEETLRFPRCKILAICDKQGNAIWENDELDEWFEDVLDFAPTACSRIS